jgi:cytochrome b
MSLASSDTSPPDAEVETPEIETVVLWDPLIRIYHWLLFAAVTTGWLLGKFGPDIMTLHFYAGYTVIGLLAFRLVWGLFGPPAVRFRGFFHAPATTWGYVRGMFTRRPSYWRGHNPVGALSALAILLVLAAQATAGLFADPEDYINAGPLASEVRASTARAALSWHNSLSTVILALVLLHVGAILYYRFWKGEDLVRPMITGRKAVRVRRRR